MTSKWGEPIVMVALGVISIGAVVFVNQLFKKSGPDRLDTQSKILAEDVRRLKDDSDARNQAILRRLDQLESTVKDIQQRITDQEATGSRFPQPETLSPPPDRQNGAKANTSASEGQNQVQEALIRGWRYLAKHAFDPKDHDRVLSALVAAYKVQGLSEEVNNSLVAAIQQVNEIGMTQVLSEVRNLAAPDAVERLRTFLRTPMLTRGQSSRIKSALAAYTRPGGGAAQATGKRGVK
jgi:hypothetical protein